MVWLRHPPGPPWPRKRASTRSPTAWLALVALLAWAPAAIARQWYEHYDRGLKAARSSQWSEALDEFEAAAKLEPKARARVRTYGRQFLLAYDPAYHRALCLVELGRVEEARPFLAEARAAAVTAPKLLDALERRMVPVRHESRPTVVETRSPASSSPALPPSSAEPPVLGPKPAMDSPASGFATPSPPSPTPTTGRLHVRSTPSGARLSLDGRDRGATPMLGLELSPGPHRVRLESEGFVPWEQVVTLAAGEALNLEVALASPTPPSGVGEVGFTAISPASGETLLEPVADPPLLPEPPPINQGQTTRAPYGRWILGSLLAAGVLVFVGLGWRRRSEPQPPTSASSGLWHVRLLGSRLGDYELLGELGRGGMASTFRAQRRHDGRLVALKVPHPSGDSTYRERFLREGRLGETLHHPAIVRLFEAGEDRGVPFLAMELIEGQTLKQTLADQPLGLPVARALEVARAIGEALDYAHGKGVVHRDLKPENVMLTPDGGVKVMDFGVARVADQPGLTTSEFFLGSPLYAAPEAIEPRRIGPRSDLYSLGIVLYEMATGQLPFVHESVYRLLELHQQEPLPASTALPRPVTLPEGLWQVIERLCAKRPEDRYPSAQALLVDLGRLVEGGGAAA